MILVRQNKKHRKNTKGMYLLRISFIGAGNMAGAIINSIINSGRAKPKDITVFDIDKAKYDHYSSMGVSTADTKKEVCEASPFVVLAVKPQDYESLLIGIKEECGDISKKVFISIAAAISTDFITKTLSADCPVIRVMPNTPLLIGCGATAISKNQYVDDKEFTKICGVFAASGVVSVLPESQMNAIISVNSTSPAYIYLLAKAMIDGAVAQGIDSKVAAELVFQTIKGSAEMLIKTDLEPSALIKMVASPKGTTEASLRSFENEGFEQIVQHAMLACTNRAEEIKK